MKITLCGSIAFYTEMKSIQNQLVNFGHEVKIPELSLKAHEEFGAEKKVYFDGFIQQNGGIDSFPVGHTIWNLKGEAIRDHYEKIDWADAILVINEDKRGIKGYVGGNTLIEIGVAFYLKKKIFIMNDVSSQLSYTQEIFGMKPVLLNGDLKCIN